MLALNFSSKKSLCNFDLTSQPVRLHKKGAIEYIEVVILIFEDGFRPHIPMSNPHLVQLGQPSTNFINREPN